MTKKIVSIKSALVPIGPGSDGEQALALAHSIASEVILVGIVPIAEGQSVSAGAQTARQIRKRLLSLSNTNIRFKSTVIVSATPWDDIKNIIQDEEPDILVFEWKDGKTIWGEPVSNILTNPICNMAVVGGRMPVAPERTLIAVRGGPYAELALQIGISLQTNQLDVLHVAITGTASDAPFKGMSEFIKQIPGMNLRSISADDVSRAIFDESKNYNVVVLGVTASRATGASLVGPVAEKMLSDPSKTTIIVKSRRPMSESMLDESAGTRAISVLVDKWFAENTFHAGEFSNLKDLMALKEKQGSTISLALPALNEEKTVGKVIQTIKTALMEDVPLLDEIVLMDSNSTDRTREIASDLGVPVHIHQHLLADLKPRSGKGEA